MMNSKLTSAGYEVSIPPQKRLAETQCKKILAFGDSRMTYQSAMGWAWNPSLVNITGIELRGTNQTFPTGSTVFTWNAAARTMQVTAPGDTIGEPVEISDGARYIVYSGNGVDYVRMSGYSRSFSATDKTDTLASGGSSTNNARRQTGSMLNIVDALTHRRFNILPDFGIGGNTTADMLRRLQQVVTSDADIVLVGGGTNDVVAAGRAPASIAADHTTMWDALLASGKIVIVELITPRFGSIAAFGGTANDPGALATHGPGIIETNRLLIAAASTRPGVWLVDGFSENVDLITGRVKDYSTLDGLHDGTLMAVSHAKKVAGILNNLFPDTRSTQNVGGLALYNASTMPGGNLIVTNRGSFTGSGGILNAGAALTPVWLPLTAYTLNQHVIVGDRLYRCVAAGTSGASQSMRPQNKGGTVTDGTCSWLYVSSGVCVLSWTAATAYNVEDVVVTTAGKKYQCVTAGTSAASAPTATTATVTDNTVTWAFVDTGCSTGFAAGWIGGRSTGANINSTWHKVIAEDGREYQEGVITGAIVNQKTANAEDIQIYTGSTPIVLANMDDGDMLDTSVVMRIIDSDQCAGVTMDQIYTGYPINHDNTCMGNAPRGLLIDDPFTLALQPFRWVGAGAATITAMNQRIRIASMQNGVFRVRLRTMDTHKIL
jgi:lysophospholipase L1-like esterase